ncbi:unnamed protein product (macronuclear) [Paramecium tetraurelia]|uniref:Cyclic nucleotide-binding domain-containing protein n=1 Tax=Paramecium tetraurelia TaxID=5888 RepID=A0EFW0_PARTE|nr:uncharacterized protein GSPATT00026524001 [Paramecium tetraurelia]CAK94201.1 unnamed protein product [Paramecium tetraurelia]|eukprot:XP_001461574.1 hypothetical protein (macronuclear) [Paramecium tetraurelia strain d4-2]
MIQNSTTSPPNEDSLCKPIIQLMSTMNQQQMRVRKPSEESRNKKQSETQQAKNTHPKSPTLTQVSVQIASDRASPHNQQDLLLINEEPSNKEDSQQLSMIKKRNDSDQLFKKSVFNKNRSSHSSFSLLYKEKATLIQNIIITKKQFKLINDLSAQYFVPLKDKLEKVFHHEWTPKLFILCVYIIFLLFYLTILLIEIGCNHLEISNLAIFQYIMLITQIIELTQQIIYYKGDIMNIIIDNLGLISFISYQIHNLQSQKLIIKRINNCIQNLNFYSNQQDYIFVIQVTIQLHFSTCLAQTIIFMFSLSEQDYIVYIQNIFTLIFVTPQIIAQYYFVIYLIKILLIIFYFYKFKQILNYQSLNLDQQFNYEPNTQKLIYEYSHQKQRQIFDINLMPNFLQKKMKREKYFKILSSIPILNSSFSTQTLLNICDLIHEQILRPNEIILQKPALYIHLQGVIQLFQKGDSSLQEFKITKIKNPFQIFNNGAFFKNQMQGIQFESLGYSKVACLNSHQFHQLIKQCPREFQKYRMLIDTILLHNDPYLTSISCFGCHQAHEITQCPFVNYKPNKYLIINGYKLNNQQSRVSDFRREVRRKRKIIIKQENNQEDSESFESEEKDKVASFNKILPSSNSSLSSNPINQLELSSVPYVSYSHSGQTLYSKKMDSENFFSAQGFSSSNSSKKIIQNEFKEVGQSKFQKYGQQEEQQGSSFQCNPLQKVQDSLFHNKIKIKKSRVEKQTQFQKYQTDIQQKQSQRNSRKNQTMMKKKKNFN